MVSKNTILISVNKETKKDLDKLKLHPSLSYNDVVVELINFWKINHQSPEPEIHNLPTMLDTEKLCYFCNAKEVIDETLGKITQHEILCNAPKTNTSAGN